MKNNGCHQMHPEYTPPRALRLSQVIKKSDMRELRLLLPNG